MIIGEAFGLLSYTDIKANNMSREQVLTELDYYINHANNRTHCQINYELLITWELNYPNDQDIQAKILNLKRQIAKNYLLKEKLLKRICLDFERPE